MRNLLLPILIVALAHGLHAQGRVRTIETDSGRVVQHYFTTGQLSTVEWTDKEGRFGRSRALKRAGTVIVDHHTRRIAGHASVHFSYHPNGAVSRSEFSDAPDAGIQWYRSTTTFDDQGNRTGFSEQGHDDRHVIPHPGTTFTQPEEPVNPTPVPVREPEVAPCQKLFVNEVFVVNATRHAARVRVRVTNPSPTLGPAEHTLAPGDTVRLGTYTTGETFEGPENHLALEAMRVVRNRKRPAASGELRTNEAQVSPEHRRYYMVLSGWRPPRRER